MPESTHPMVIRNRLRVEISEGDLDINGKSADEKHGFEGRHARFAHPGKSIMAVVLCLFCAGYLATTIRRGEGSTSSDIAPASEPIAQAQIIKIVPHTKRDWSHCTEGRPPKNPIDVDRKVEPLWLPAYPTALPAAPWAGLITALTGVHNGAKSFYNKSKSLKRCHNVKSDTNVQAITCENVHPIVPIDPSAQAANFGSVVLLALRNPLTAFPAYHQSKAELYHGQKGQVKKEEWIEFRNQYLEEKLFAEWKNFIMTWRDMAPYTVGDYMPHEYWADDTKGPSLVITLSKILKKEGFPVLYDAVTDDGIRDLECLWREHIHEAIADEEKKRGDRYVPKYTKRQLEFMATGLDNFVREIEEKQDDGKRPGDGHLMTILRDYSSAIRSDSGDNE